MKRREFLKLSATASAVTCVTACGSDKAQTIVPEMPPQENHFWSACLCNCGSNCPLKVITVDGRIVRIEPESHGEDSFDFPQIRPCPRGHSNRQRVYNPDRLLYPMKRVGKRGEGKFERISWDQAITEIGTKLKQTYEQHGPRAVYQNRGSGAFYDINGKNAWARLLNLMGGGLQHYGSYSSSMVRTVMPYIFGSRKSSTPREMQYSDLLVFFGYNPLETRMSGSGEGMEVQTVTRGKKVIHIDCRYNDTAMGRESEYYACRPGTDAALCQAMAYVLIEEQMLDEPFLAQKCYGFRAEPETPDQRKGHEGKMLPALPYEESYEAMILGVKDGQPKTPEWAAPICGIPADSIRHIARQIGQAKAPYLAPGLGLQRHINGEDNIRAIMTLAMLVGAIGKRGTNTGDYPKSPRKIYSKGIPKVSAQQQAPIDKAKISMFSWTDAVVDGENMTVLKDGVKLPAEELDENGDGKLGTNIKAVINFASGCLVNQHGNAFGTTRILQDESKCEMIVVIDNHMTSSAKLADYILPDCTWLESTDFANKTYYAGAVSYMTALKSGIKPLGECRSSFAVCADIAEVLGVRDAFTEGKTPEQWVDHYYQTGVRPLDPSLFPESVEEMQKVGVIKTFSPCDDSEESARVNCAMWDYVQHGGTLNTASGKLEIYSHALREISEAWEVPDYWLDKEHYINPLARYWIGLEGYEDNSPELADKPLQLIGHHTKARTHSSFGSVKWLKEAANGDAVWINPEDAAKYGILDNEYAIVESLRGKVKVKARITNRIMPGVMSLSNGAWFNPQNGVDVGGCVNALTSSGRPSPLAKGNPQHTNRVKIYKA